MTNHSCGAYNEVATPKPVPVTVSTVRRVIQITIRDVAKYLGISPTTVSRYFNGYPDINAETKLRIQKAVEELNYVPNTAARSISQKQTHVIGLTIPDIEDSFFAENASGAEEVFQKKGYDLIYGSTQRDSKRMVEFINRARGMRFDGLIITPDVWDDALIETLKRVDIPTVALRRRPPKGIDVPYVDGDHYQGARQMVEYFYQNGHRNIGHIVLSTDIGEERLRGYRDAMQAYGLEPYAVRNELPAHKLKDAVKCGRQAMEQMLRELPETTAVFAASDQLAVGAMEYLAMQGIRVPDEISVSGTGDMEYSDLHWLKLTTISLERAEMGKKAAQMLLRMIDKEVKHPKSVLVETHLIIRDSTRNIK